MEMGGESGRDSGSRSDGECKTWIGDGCQRDLTSLLWPPHGAQTEGVKSLPWLQAWEKPSSPAKGNSGRRRHGRLVSGQRSPTTSRLVVRQLDQHP